MAALDSCDSSRQERGCAGAERFHRLYKSQVFLKSCFSRSNEGKKKGLQTSWTSYSSPKWFYPSSYSFPPAITLIKELPGSLHFLRESLPFFSSWFLSFSFFLVRMMMEQENLPDKLLELVQWPNLTSLSLLLILWRQQQRNGRWCRNGSPE